MKKKISIALSLCLILSFSSCEAEEKTDSIPVNVTVEDFESGKDSTTPPSHTMPPSTTPRITETTEEEKPKFATVSFAAAGDNLIHSSIYNQAEKRTNFNGYDFSYAYQNIADLISESDIAMLNQETLICNDQYKPSTYPQFNSPKALGDHMIELGFDVFTIANNHTLDKYEDGLKACLDYWDTKENSVVAGAYRNIADRDNIRTNEINGLTFSYLSYTESLNGLSLPVGSEMIIGDANNVELMVEEVTDASKISDVCVVALHWGVENSDVITEYQRTTAKILAEAGADIIIGNHPHVLRDIELIDRDDGSQALCAYSMGNFISAQSVGQNLIGGILQFDIMVLLDDNGSERDKQPIITGIRLIPIVTHYDKDYTNIRIYKFSDYTPELADTHGVKAFSKFNYDYIKQVLETNIDSRFLVLK